MLELHPVLWCGLVTVAAAAARSNQKLYEHESTIDTIEMGVRQYVPALGRFLSRDPVAGGNENTYNYPLDPRNNCDLTGTIGLCMCGGFGELEYFAATQAMAGAYGDVGAWGGVGGSLAGSSGGGAVKETGPIQPKDNAVYVPPTIAQKIVMDAIPSGSGLKRDPAHLASVFMQSSIGTSGRAFIQRGGDGVARLYVTVRGGFNGRIGQYEYVVTGQNQLTHGFFRSGKFF